MIVDDIRVTVTGNSSSIGYWLQRPKDDLSPFENVNSEQYQNLLACLKPMIDAPNDGKLIWALTKHAKAFITVRCFSVSRIMFWTKDDFLWKVNGTDGWYETDDLLGYCDIV
jgi:hypothetical protein